MSTRMNRMLVVTGLACSAALATAALAMEWGTAEPDDLKGDFKQPLKEALSGGGSNSKTVTVMTESNGKDTYKVTIKNGDISAEVNGEKVPAERIRQKDGKVEILDANGGVIKSFNVSVNGPIAVQGFDLGNLGALQEMRRNVERRGGTGDGQRREIRIKGDGKGGFKVDNGDDKVAARWSPAQNAANSNPPPVMIGITMSEPEDSVLEFLSLENAIRIDTVVDGLPAAQAGLKSGDLIVEVKGEKNIGQERFREILRGTKPGDELAIKIARKGNQMQDVTLKLVSFDQSKLSTMVVPGVDMQDDVAVVRPPQTRMWDDAQRQLDAAMKSLKENPNLQPEALKKQLDEALSKASEALKSAQGQMREGLNEMRFRLDHGGDDNVTIFRGRDGAEVPLLGDMFVVPSTPGTPGTPRVEVRGMRMDSASDKRMEAIERKIDDLNKRMDEIRDLLKEKQGR